jgi:thiosulfate/3-mercaptopyruvate sulfurtransferase
MAMRLWVLLLLLTAVQAADLPLVQPKVVAAALSGGTKPVVLYVGPNVMYRSKHVPGAVYAGPGNRPDGIELLKTSAKGFPKDREIILYCGCCPWDRCPNIRPATEALRAMGFTRVKAMYLPDDFKADWIDKGYPVETSRP